MGSLGDKGVPARSGEETGLLEGERGVIDLRTILRQGPPLVACGAFDGLTARLVERAGFDGIWASGFCISASKGMPDANVLTMADLIDRVAEMARAVSIPIIVDCDEGYGDSAGTVRLVAGLADVGAQAICIEDNRHPKVNSFLAGGRRSLVPARAHCERLMAVKAAVPDLVLIARTEALIAGLGLDEGLARGRAYAESGADLVLIHSRFTGLGQFRELAASWDGPRPLIVIPTLARGVACDDLAALGFRIVIFANQALRAAVFGIERVLARIRALGCQDAVLGDLSSLDHLFELTGLTADGASSRARDGGGIVPRA
jgi:phosphoenolpyruvate phosphomutase